MSHKYHLERMVNGFKPVNGFKLVFQYHPKSIKFIHLMPNCVAFSLLSFTHSFCSDSLKKSQTLDKKHQYSSFVIQGEDRSRTASLNLNCTHCYTCSGLLQSSCCSDPALPSTTLSPSPAVPMDTSHHMKASRTNGLHEWHCCFFRSLVLLYLTKEARVKASQASGKLMVDAEGL